MTGSSRTSEIHCRSNDPTGLATTQSEAGRFPSTPLELGCEAALRALFGFTKDGRRQPADIDAESVKLAGLQVPPANPVTKEMPTEFMRTHRRTAYRMGSNGNLIQVEP